jgi:hypothetical protein
MLYLLEVAYVVFLPNVKDEATRQLAGFVTAGGVRSAA